MKRAMRWLAGTIAGGVVWWAVTVGGGIAVSAAVAALSGIRQPWVSLLAVGVFGASAGLLLAGLRVVVSLLPRKARGAVRPRPAQPFRLPAFLTPQGQLTTLIEEGRTLAQVIPTPSGEPSNRLALMMAGADVNYPARVYEWEMRAWRLLNAPSLSQYRGLFTKPTTAHRLEGLREHVEERVRQLQTILARV